MTRMYAPVPQPRKNVDQFVKDAFSRARFVRISRLGSPLPRVAQCAVEETLQFRCLRSMNIGERRLRKFHRAGASPTTPVFRVAMRLLTSARIVKGSIGLK